MVKAQDYQNPQITGGGESSAAGSLDKDIPTTPKKKATQRIKSFFSVGNSKKDSSHHHHNSSPKSTTPNSKRGMSFDDVRRRSSSLLSNFTIHDGDSSTDSTSNTDSDQFDSLRTHNGFNPTKIIKNYKNQQDKPLMNDTGFLDASQGYDKSNFFSKYIPKPAHIKFIKKSNTTPEITKRLFLAQELSQNFTKAELDLNPQLVASLNANGINIATEEITNSVWVMQFSCDGRFLATAGKGNTIKVWKVLSTPMDKFQDGDSPGGDSLTDEIHDSNEAGNENGATDSSSNPARLDTDKGKPSTLFAPVFQSSCYRHYIGHEHDILSLDWSKNDFILSSSMDKTVRLWNIKQKNSLRIYQHTDFVTCVKFHPTDDRFFVSGCLDHRVRLWSILDNDVVYEFNARNLVTAVGFTPNGSLVIVGTFTGVLYFLDTQNLELRHSLDIHKTNKNIISITSSSATQGQGGGSSSCKVTGIESYQDLEDIKILITTNDSKIRMISLKNRSLEYYFKGQENSSSQIIATVSDDKKYIISGSEDHWTYIWELHDKDSESNHEDHKENSTNSIKSLLHNKRKRKDYVAFHSNHSVVTSALIAPLGTSKVLALSNDYIYELQNEYYKNNGTPQSVDNSLFHPSFIGSIIVSADDKGQIKVFRKDVAAEVRTRLNANNNNGKSPKKALKEMSDNSLQLLATNSRNTLTNHNNASCTSLIRADSIGQRLLSSANGILNNNKLNAKSADQFLNHPATSGAHNGTLSPGTERSRSGTVNSMQRSINDLDLSNTTNLFCDVCHGDKFKVVRGDNFSSSGKEMSVYCVECGNLVNT
ncbi:hypothetical protein WICPIJ_007339 [Wickerhamomyces pijperi]|uniref:WD repeat-containing protein 44 n=1 Tax=Wickerhamomyces pijperi TaxID=599730 RepID=A0A9P8TK17_WICPI|nr:hypothetical protein WICPIJ_007339 [Wickerhamomyces pijperi]